MIISKIYNNNVVTSCDSQGNEIVVLGCGIAFQKKCGEQIDESKVEKIFTLKDKSVISKLEELIKDIPPVYLEITEKIVSYAKSELASELNENIYLTLTDHISFAVKRIQEGLIISNPMTWDIKCFYRDEYRVGLKALEIISNTLQVDLPEDEAAFITLHIVNASMNVEVSTSVNMTKFIGEILSIIKAHYQTDFNEDSIYYYRLVTHLKLFAQRLMSVEGKVPGDDLLFKTVKRYYPETYTCVQKINKYVKQKYGKEISKEEMGYLMVHLKYVREKQAETKQFN
jgi:Transcriptional antiterminator